jgi:hypothetical protein
LWTISLKTTAQKVGTFAGIRLAYWSFVLYIIADIHMVFREEPLFIPEGIPCFFTGHLRNVFCLFPHSLITPETAPASQLSSSFHPSLLQSTIGVNGCRINHREVRMKKCAGQSVGMVLVVFIAFSLLLCDKDPASSSSKNKVTCDAGCSSMSWGIKGESGSQTYNATCNRTYNASGEYVESCNGSLTYSGSGKTYNFSATYDWPNCKITVTVAGYGSCTDKASTSRMASSDDGCHCEGIEVEDMVIKYKD